MNLNIKDQVSIFTKKINSSSKSFKVEMQLISSFKISVVFKLRKCLIINLVRTGQHYKPHTNFSAVLCLKIFKTIKLSIFI